MKSNGRVKDATSLAEQAWENLSSTVESAGKRARSAADEASHRMTSTSKEAKRRADAAIDALAGRQPSKPWGWLVGLAAAGVALGWLAAKFGKQAVQQAQVIKDQAVQQAQTVKDRALDGKSAGDPLAVLPEDEFSTGVADLSSRR
jgi:hypothetical protein